MFAFNGPTGVRRVHMASIPTSQAPRSKDAVARELAQAHYRVDSGIISIVRLLEQSPEQEADQNSPIKLLEVSQNTTAVGIRPVFFGRDAASGIHYRSVIIEVTPDEYEAIQEQPSSLPNHWRIDEPIPRAE